MSSNPVNLAVRFVLELVALTAFGYWGWTQHQGIMRWVLATGVPVIAAALWGTFRVPGDPGDAPVAVSGVVRLGLEFVFFAGAVWCLAAAEQQIFAIVVGVVLVIHYLVSYDRVLDFLGAR